MARAIFVENGSTIIMPKSAPASSLPPLQLDRASATPLSRQLACGDRARHPRRPGPCRCAPAVDARPERRTRRRAQHGQLRVRSTRGRGLHREQGRLGDVRRVLATGTGAPRAPPATRNNATPERAPPARTAERARTRRRCSLTRSKVPIHASVTPTSTTFPFATWKRLLSRQIDALARSRFGYTAARGYEPLHEAIVQHLARTRGMSAIAGAGHRRQRHAAGARPLCARTPRPARPRPVRGSGLHRRADGVRRQRPRRSAQFRSTTRGWTLRGRPCAPHARRT